MAHPHKISPAEAATQTLPERYLVVPGHAGALDSAAALRLLRRLDKLLAAGHHRLAVDLHAVATCEIEGIDVLLKVGSRLQEHNRHLQLAVPNETLSQLLKSTGRTDLFVIHPTIDEAITAAGADQAGGGPR